MNNLNFVRGLVLMAIALMFGLGSLNYTIGHFNRAGPGLFPLMVSCLLFLLGLITVACSRLYEICCHPNHKILVPLIFLFFCFSIRTRPATALILMEALHNLAFGFE